VALKSGELLLSFFFFFFFFIFWNSELPPETTELSGLVPESCVKFDDFLEETDTGGD